MSRKKSQKGARLRQLTIRGFEPRLEHRIRQIARAEGLSLNRAVMKLLRRGAGLGDVDATRDVVGDSLDHLIGTWSEEEGREFEEAVRDLTEVDPSLWS
jgi:hypothetical protein